MKFEIGAPAPPHPKGGDLTQDEIIDWVEKGVFSGLTVSAMLRADDRFPDRGTWYLWGNGPRAKELDQRFARARDEGFEELADECIRIAYDAFGDVDVMVDARGQKRVKFVGESVARSRVKIDTILKLLAVWNPAKYTERLDLTSMGQAISTETNVTMLATRMQSLLQLAEQRKLEAPTIEGELS